MNQKQIWLFTFISIGIGLSLLNVENVSAYQYETYQITPDQKDSVQIRVDAGDIATIEITIVLGNFSLELIDISNYGQAQSSQYYSIIQSTSLCENQSVEWNYQSFSGDDAYLLMINQDPSQIGVVRVVQNKIPVAFIIVFSTIGTLTVILGILSIYCKKHPIKHKFDPKGKNSDSIDEIIMYSGTGMSIIGEILIILQASLAFLSLMFIYNDITWMILIPGPIFLLLESYIKFAKKNKIRGLGGISYFFLILVICASLFLGGGWIIGTVLGICGGILRVTRK